ncbi:MAG: hypothetical protein R8G66_17615 [Cytophagales bacterium]|nr:hypothetical protein [Cytophagales bacterium]
MNVSLFSSESECRILELKEPIVLNSKNFKEFDEKLDDFAQSKRDLDILVFEIRSGKTNRLIRVYSEDDGLVLFNSQRSNSEHLLIDNKCQDKVQKLISTIDSKNYMVTCLDYSSSIKLTVFMIKKKGNNFFSLSINSDDFLYSQDGANREVIFDEIQLLKAIYGIANKDRATN